MKLEQKIRIDTKVSGWYLKDIENEIETLEDSLNAEDFEWNQAYVLGDLRIRLAYCQRVIDYINQLTYEDVKGGK